MISSVFEVPFDSFQVGVIASGMPKTWQMFLVYVGKGVMAGLGVWVFRITKIKARQQ